jgi:polyvinyl alcohol dehydrogenase (cytochrome)
MARRLAHLLVVLCTTIVFCLLLPPIAPGQNAGAPGPEIYTKHCASCHDSGALRIPPQAALRQRTIPSIFKSLNAGVMKEQAASLTPAERMAVAQWLGRTTAAKLEASKISNACSSSAASPTAGSWTSWGGGLANLRFQPAAQAGLNAAQTSRLKLKWAFGVPDVTQVRSQPAVFGGNILFAGGSTLYSLDADSGCTRWATELPASVRSGVAIGSPAGKPLAFFGDGAANVYAVEVATGAPLWQVHVDSHPSAVLTGTPAYYDGTLYVPVSSYEELAATDPSYVCCTFRGSIIALDANSGKRLWQTFTIAEQASASGTNKQGMARSGPSGAAVWSTPTLDPDKHRLYVGTGDNYSDPSTPMSDAVLALAMDTGKIEWSRQFSNGDAWNVACLTPGSKNCPDANGSDFDFGSSPILLSLPGGGRALILAQKSGAIHAIDPDNKGKLLWQAQVGNGGVLGGVEWGPATDSERLFVAISDEAFLPTTPSSLDPAKGGGLFAFSVKSGKRLWDTPPSPCDARRPCSPAQTGAITSIPGVVFSGSLNGHLRAVSAADGKVLWDFDTGQQFKTVNGVAAHGGSMSVAGPVVVGGTVYALSGYDAFGEAPGNVLLAFTVDGH